MKHSSRPRPAKSLLSVVLLPLILFAGLALVVQRALPAANWAKVLSVNLVTTGELVVNGGFETTGSWKSPSLSGISRVKSPVHSGIWSLQMLVSNVQDRVYYQDLRADKSYFYTASVWVNTSAITDGGASLQIQWLNAGSQPYPAPTSAILGTDIVGSLTGTNAWTQLTKANMTPPDGTVVARFILKTQKSTVNSGKAWYDDASFTGVAGTPSFVATPISDMLPTQTYLGIPTATGGLYENGNSVPSDHDAAGQTFAAKVQPLDTNGNPSPSGKIVLMSAGMSNPADKWCGAFGADCYLTPLLTNAFMSQWNSSGTVNHTTVAVVNGAQGGQVTVNWSPSTAKVYNNINNNALIPLGLSEKQVQVIWLEHGDVFPKVSLTGNPPPPDADAFTLESLSGESLRAMKIRYPNLQLVFISSRTYAGYAQGPANPEPWAYESGFSVKWLIAAQINQMRTGTVDPVAGDLNYNNGTAPWIAWGPYLWADGTIARSDGVTWNIEDSLPGDGMHPSQTSGILKVSNQLMSFLSTSVYTKCWFTSGGCAR